MNNPDLNNEVKAGRKGKSCLSGCLIFLLGFCAVFGIVLSFVSSNSNKNQNNTQQKATEVVLDVTKFRHMTSDELVKEFGQPDEITEDIVSPQSNIPCKFYAYNHSEKLGWSSFTLVNDRVIAFSSLDKEYPLLKDEENLRQFGINVGENCKVVAKSADRLQYRTPSDNVDDFKIQLMGSDKITNFTVTYDYQYYEEYYLPVSDNETAKYQVKTQDTIKQLLLAPSTADFQTINVGKNRYYVATKSSVDAQNAFGTPIRQEFLVVYQVGTEHIVYLNFNGEVLVNDGYVPPFDLVKQETIS